MERRKYGIGLGLVSLFTAKVVWAVFFAAKMVLALCFS